MPGKLVKLLSDFKEPEALAFVEKSLAEGADPMDLLAQAKEAMNIVGQRFATEEYFIPDLVFSGEILKGIVKVLEPHLKKDKDEKRLEKVIIGTVVFRVSLKSHKTSSRHAGGHSLSDNSHNTIFLFAPLRPPKHKTRPLSIMRNRASAFASRIPDYRAITCEISCIPIGSFEDSTTLVMLRRKSQAFSSTRHPG